MNLKLKALISSVSSLSEAIRRGEMRSLSELFLEYFTTNSVNRPGCNKEFIEVRILL